MENKASKPKFRFGIRTLLGIVFLVAMFLGPVTKFQQARYQQSQVTIIELVSGGVSYEHQWVNGKLTPFSDPRPAWLKPWVPPHTFLKPRTARVKLPDLNRQYEVVLESLSSLDTLTGLDLWLVDDPLLDTSTLKKLDRLTELAIDSPHPNDAVPLNQIEFISELARLEKLSIGMEGQELPNMENLKRLHTLNIAAAIDSAELEKLSGLKQLDCSGSHHYPEGFLDLKRISHLSELETLDCSNCAGRNFDQLANLQALKKLDFIEYRVPVANSKPNESEYQPVDLLPLRNLVQMEELAFGIEYHDRAIDLSALKEMSKLRSLKCNCKVSNLKALQALPIQTLEFKEVADSLEPIANFKSLTKLTLNFQPDVDYTPLNRCSTLTELRLIVYERDRNDFGKKIAFTGIKKLFIDCDIAVDASEFEIMDSLEELRLYKLQSVDGLLKQPSLRELILASCEYETMKDLPKLTQIPTFQSATSPWTGEIYYERVETTQPQDASE